MNLPSIHSIRRHGWSSLPGLTFIISSLLLLLPGNARGDDHIICERSRTYAGATSPRRTTEVWLSDSAVSVKTTKLTIFRFDRGVIWYISADRSQYAEVPLTRPTDADDAPDTSLHRRGFTYQPKYDWSLIETGKEDTVRGLRCRLMHARGDADYSQKDIDLWITKDVPIRLDRYYEKFLQYSLDADWLKLYGASRLLQNHLVVRSRETAELAIAPTAISLVEITMVEVASPPEHVYELPSGCVKVSSPDDLH